MSSSAAYLGSPSKPAQKRRDSIEEEEGLLSGISDTSSKYPETRRPWSRGKIILTAVFFIFLLISGAFVRSLSWKPVPPPSQSHSLWFTGEGELRSNGTHDFKRTVILVSIDGLRYNDHLPPGCPNVLSYFVLPERTIWTEV